MAILEIDLERLGQPMSPEAPAGVNLRTDDEGRKIWSSLRGLRDDARRIERDADRDASLDRAGAAAYWRKVSELAAGILRDRSHDLGVAAYLIESLARTEGFGGLRRGCDAARVMVESHWADLYPVPDPEDGPVSDEERCEQLALPLAQLAGLDSDGLLRPAILMIPLVDGRGGERFGLAQWKSSQALKAKNLEGSNLDTAVDRGATSPQQFADGAAATDDGFFQRLYGEIKEASLAWQQLARAVDEASGGRADLPVTPLNELFEECEAVVRSVGGTAIAAVLAAASASEPDSQPQAAAPDAPAAPASPQILPAVLASPGASRQDVLRLLESVADYFEAHDPHSLLGAQVRNVVRMAKLPRKEFYRELIVEPVGLRSLGRVSGLSFDDE